MIYLDTSAALKLVISEPESAALAAWLDEQAQPLISSSLLRVELRRALRRTGLHAIDRAQAVLASITQRGVDAILDDAAELDGTHLRSLDSLHLATALSVQRLDHFVTYDQRLADHVQAAGLAVAAPA